MLAFVACNPPEASGTRAVADAGSVPSLAPPPGRPAPAAPSEGWNDGQIAWRTFDDAVTRARAEHKPICVVMHADWCVHCRSYRHVFDDPRIVARARSMEMVLLNVDHSPEVASRFQLDGAYVPRTYFLHPDGTPIADIDAHRPRFRYFFDEHDPASLLAGMDAALARP